MKDSVMSDFEKERDTDDHWWLKPCGCGKGFYGAIHDELPGFRDTQEFWCPHCRSATKSVVGGREVSGYGLHFPKEYDGLTEGVPNGEDARRQWETVVFEDFMAGKKPRKIGQQMVIGSLTFQSETKAKEYFRKVLHAHEDGKPIPAPAHDHLLALLQRHSEVDDKIGVGVSHFTVMKAIYGTFCFRVHRTDGTSTDFSYIRALSGRPRRMMEEFYDACRSTIMEDMREFRYQWFQKHGVGRAPCASTGKLLTIREAHVDHRPPMTFKKICDQFLEDYWISPSYHWISPPKDNQLKAVITDPQILADFLKYHREHADLWVIEKSLNLSLGSRLKEKT